MLRRFLVFKQKVCVFLVFHGLLLSSSGFQMFLEERMFGFCDGFYFPYVGFMNKALLVLSFWRC